MHRFEEVYPRLYSKLVDIFHQSRARFISVTACGVFTVDRSDYYAVIILWIGFEEVLSVWVMRYTSSISHSHIDNKTKAISKINESDWNLNLNLHHKQVAVALVLYTVHNS